MKNKNGIWKSRVGDLMVLKSSAKAFDPEFWTEVFKIQYVNDKGVKNPIIEEGKEIKYLDNGEYIIIDKEANIGTTTVGTSSSKATAKSVIDWYNSLSHHDREIVREAIK